MFSDFSLEFRNKMYYVKIFKQLLYSNQEKKEQKLLPGLLSKVKFSEG